MVVFLYALWRDGELDRYPHLYQYLSAFLLFLLLLYVLVRVLKKTRTVVAD